MSLLALAAREIARQEAEQIERALEAAVGEGYDVAVTREMCLEGSKVSVTLRFYRVSPGDSPPSQSTVFRVSDMGPWRHA